MSASTKLSTAVKALCFMARQPQNSFSSAEISSGIGANASKLRKLLSMLSKSEIVRSIKGSGGGFLLNKPSDKIHLQEIYCAIEDRKAFYLDVHQAASVVHIPLSDSLNEYFLNFFTEIQVDIESKMRKIFLNEIMDKAGIKVAERC